MPLAFGIGGALVFVALCLAGVVQHAKARRAA
jgi:hypothetical protein